MPFFSVLVTAYNAEPWIAECLESVRGQDFRDFEVLVGDDASTDGTARAVDSFDVRFALVRSQQNRGGGENFVNLIRFACGEVCVELGADDYFLVPEALSRIKAEYDAFEKCDATSGMFVITPDGGIRGDKPPALWWKSWCFAKPLTFRREVALRALDEFKDDILDPATGGVPRYGWDVAVYFPVMALARRYRWIPDVLYAYRVHERNDQNEHRAEQLQTEHRLSAAMDKRLAAPMPWWPREMKDALKK